MRHAGGLDLGVVSTDSDDSSGDHDDSSDASDSDDDDVDALSSGPGRRGGVAAGMVRPQPRAAGSNPPSSSLVHPALILARSSVGAGFQGCQESAQGCAAAAATGPEHLDPGEAQEPAAAARSGTAPAAAQGHRGIAADCHPAGRSGRARADSRADGPQSAADVRDGWGGRVGRARRGFGAGLVAGRALAVRPHPGDAAVGQPWADGRLVDARRQQARCWLEVPPYVALQQLYAITTATGC